MPNLSERGPVHHSRSSTRNIPEVLRLDPRKVEEGIAKLRASIQLGWKKHPSSRLSRLPSDWRGRIIT